MQASLQTQSVAEPNPDPGVQSDRSPHRAPYQRNLFNTRETSQVVPIQAFAPRATARSAERTEASKPRVRPAAPGQQTLEFSSPSATPEAEPIIYCDAPVAIPAHRIMAAAVDFSIVAIALGLFLAVFQISLNLFHITGVAMLTKQTLPFFGGVAAVFGLLYKILWCLAGSDTAGMRWAQLRLVNFDGLKPDREQRLYRVAAGSLSFMAAGLGVMWALVDEEALTWHDHMSKTFPTPY